MDTKGQLYVHIFGKCYQLVCVFIKTQLCDRAKLIGFSAAEDMFLNIKNTVKRIWDERKKQ